MAENKSISSLLQIQHNTINTSDELNYLEYKNIPKNSNIQHDFLTIQSQKDIKKRIIKNKTKRIV